MAQTKRQLTAADHTLVMQAILDRPLNVIHYLDSPKGQAPTQRQVIEAALRVRAFSPEVHEILQIAHDGLADFEAAQANATAETQALVAGVTAELATADDARHAADLVAQARARAPEHEVGLTFVAEMLRDGADTIYSPDYPPAEYLTSKVFSAATAGTGIGVADVAGGLIGGFSGGGPGGAAVGALVASTTGAITAAVIESL